MNIFASPAVVHAGFFSTIFSDISGGVADLSPNEAIADSVSLATTSSSSLQGYVQGGDVASDSTSDNSLSAPANPDLTPTPDCSVPVDDDTISSQFDPCSVATTTNTVTSIYVVRDGDTLSEIASLFNVSVNTIVSVNGLDRNAPLQTGEILYIPPVSGIQYTIKKNDTLQSIATYFGVDEQDIIQANGFASSSIVLNPGDTIIIPDATLDGPQQNQSSSGSTGTPAKTASGGKKKSLAWGAPGSNPAHNTNGPFYPGYYDLPLINGIETQGLHGYNAVDLAAPRGTPIVAAAAGTVIISLKNGGWNGGYGNYVVISHPNGTQTLYAHMSKNLVNVGQVVSQCQEIGLVGATGEATGPHVHFEVHGARNPFASVGTFNGGTASDCGEVIPLN